MSDLTKLTVPGQGVGTPEAQVSAQVQSPSAVPPAQEPASQEGTEEAKPVTAKDLEALREELRREVQSQVDKRDTKVREELKRFDASIAQLKAAGKELTEEEVNTLRVKVAEQARTEAVSESIAETNDPFDTKQWPQDDLASQEVIALQKKAGIEIKGDMPEAKLIDRQHGPFAFVRSYEAALQAAQERIQSASTTTETKPPSAPASARIPAASNTPSSPNMTGRGYLREANKGG